MFGIGTPELLVILVVALIFLGPKRLPEVGKALGKALGELRRASQDLKDSIELEARRTERPEASSSVARATPPTSSLPTIPSDANAAPSAAAVTPSEEPHSRVEPDPEAPGAAKQAG